MTAQVLEAPHALSAEDYRSEVKPIWCPGCGDFTVLASLVKALVSKQIPPKDTAIISGIGCSSRLPDFISTYSLHVVHGRVLPTALGLKLANPKLTVIAASGDGDGLAIGGNHFIHGARRNPTMMYIMMDNNIYGMTKGQPSPTTAVHLETKASPYGTPDVPVNPAALAILAGATFVARTFSAKTAEMTELFVKALEHPGFAFIQVLSPCVTFHNTFDFYRKATAPGAEGPKDDRLRAIQEALANNGNNLGVFLDVREESFDERMESIRELALRKGPASFEALLKEFR